MDTILDVTAGPKTHEKTCSDYEHPPTATRVMQLCVPCCSTTTTTAGPVETGPRDGENSLDRRFFAACNLPTST